MLDEARKGRTVVRLKGGDPLIYGRGGEEAEELRRHNIPYEIVPGVTTAFAAGAYLEIPLTHRAEASALAIVTGHENPLKPANSIDWRAIAVFPGTVAIYMGVARLGHIAAELVKHGKPPTTPAAVSHKVSTGEQTSVFGTLATIEADVRAAGISSPAVVLVGPVVARRPEQSWFERRPLLGLRVLTTRPEPQGSATLRRLERFGAVARNLPAMRIAPASGPGPIDAAVGELRAGRIDWLVLTSANGVEAFMRELFSRGADARVLGRAKIACVGGKTAEALGKYFLKPELVPTNGSSSEALLEVLLPLAGGRRVMLAVAEQARDLLPTRLAEVGEVVRVPIYAQIEAVDAASPLFDDLRRGEIDVAAFTSPNGLKLFLRACDGVILQRVREGQLALAVNSPRAAATLEEFGLAAAIVSADPSDEALASALEAWYSGRKRGEDGSLKAGSGEPAT